MQLALGAARGAEQAQATLTAAEEAACGPPEEASAVCVAVFRATGNELLAGASDTLLVKPAKVVLIVVLAFVASRLLRRMIKRSVGGLKGERMQRGLRGLRERAPNVLSESPAVPTLRAAQRADTIGALLSSASVFVVWSVAALMILSELGIDLGPLIAGAGIVGIALGFGAQNLVRDFLSGIFMLIEDQYGVGDIIDAGPASGTVEEVSLRTTRVRDVNGVVWHIPNGSIERVGNKSQQWSRALLDIDVAYATDIDFACTKIRETALAMWAEDEWRGVILEEPEVWGVENLGADGMSIRLVVKTQPSQQWRVSRALRARIKATFDQAGIEIPFPQRTIWHRSVDDGVAAPH